MQQNNIINNTSIDHYLGFIKFVTVFIVITFSHRNIQNSVLFLLLLSLCVRVLSHVYFTQTMQFNITVETFNQINVVQICRV